MYRSTSGSATSTHWTGEKPRKDRKSTRLNSSHSQISYAVFCLKKKSFAVIDETVTKDVLEEFLDVAGSFIGVGSFRPENRGIWVRFKVVSLAESKVRPPKGVKRHTRVRNHAVT